MPLPCPAAGAAAPADSREGVPLAALLEQLMQLQSKNLELLQALDSAPLPSPAPHQRRTPLHQGMLEDATVAAPPLPPKDPSTKRSRLSGGTAASTAAAVYQEVPQQPLQPPRPKRQPNDSWGSKDPPTKRSRLSGTTCLNNEVKIWLFS